MIIQQIIFCQLPKYLRIHEAKQEHWRVQWCTQCPSTYRASFHIRLACKKFLWKRIFSLQILMLVAIESYGCHAGPFGRRRVSPDLSDQLFSCFRNCSIPSGGRSWSNIARVHCALCHCVSSSGLWRLSLSNRHYTCCWCLQAVASLINMIPPIQATQLCSKLPQLLLADVVGIVIIRLANVSH